MAGPLAPRLAYMIEKRRSKYLKSYNGMARLLAIGCSLDFTLEMIFLGPITFEKERNIVHLVLHLVRLVGGVAQCMLAQIENVDHKRMLKATLGYNMYGIENTCVLC